MKLCLKKRRGNTIIDIIIGVMFTSVVLYFCYSLATSSINKRQQTNLERQAMCIAENIMNRLLSKGVYSLTSEPSISDATLVKIHAILIDDRINLKDKNKQIMELGGVLPVNQEIDAPFLKPNDAYDNKFSYQVIVEDYKQKTGTDSSGNPTYTKHTGLKRIIVNVYYPAKVTKYLNNVAISTKEDLASLEEEYNVVTLNTYKAAREYYQ